MILIFGIFCVRYGIVVRLLGPAELERLLELFLSFETCWMLWNVLYYIGTFFLFLVGRGLEGSLYSLCCVSAKTFIKHTLGEIHYIALQVVKVQRYSLPALKTYTCKVLCNTFSYYPRTIRLPRTKYNNANFIILDIRTYIHTIGSVNDV